MNRGDNRNPALVELILVLLFFSLSAVVLVQVFVKAHFMSEESEAQTLGLLQAQDVIEQWKEDPGHPEEILSPSDGWEEIPGTGKFRVFRRICGKDLESVEPEQGIYEMRVDLWSEGTEAGRLYYIQVQANSLQDDKTEVVLTTSRYISEQ